MDQGAEKLAAIHEGTEESQLFTGGQGLLPSSMIGRRRQSDGMGITAGCPKL